MENLDKVKIDLERKKIEGELKFRKHELDIKEKEISSYAWRNPLLIGILAAFIGLLGNILVTHQQGKNSLQVERTKTENAERQAKQELKSKLIIEAIKTGDPDSAAKNLFF